ncbi:MAG: S9 family peptidase [Rhizobacter sp.]|nr:S9 family peptidase [Rhizobacter sp.]
MTLFARALATLLLVACPLLALADRATERKLAKEPWIRGVAIGSLSLSPDGRQVAGIVYRDETVVVLIDVQTAGVKVLAKAQSDSRYRYLQPPIAVHWVANDLLVVDYSNLESMSVDLSGKKVAMLGERFIRRMSETGPLAESVLVYRDLDDGDIDLVNARTGSRQKYRVSLPGKPLAWAFDDAGVLRAVTMADSARWVGTSKVSNWYRNGAEDEWRLLEEWPATAINEVWLPLRVLPQGHTLAVLSRQGRDTRAVFRYDADARQHLEVMVAHASDDILMVEGLGQQNVDRVVTDGMRTQTFWFEPRWASLQASVDAALPGRDNDLSGDKNGRVLVMSHGDVDPGRWFVLDTKTHQFSEIAAAMPELEPADMRPMEVLRYASRDGLQIPAYLTRPAGPTDRPAPTVVFIHGGPHVRDRWEFSDEVQMLAKAGYVVFQPQFRGSAGFGQRFEKAGYRQWGRGMQDDITDGVKWLIDQKITDPSRVCIYGASYGGYAAMWGVIKTPELFKCGISFAGVSDLADMLTSGLWDDSTVISREVRRDRIGDADKDRAALDEVSPLRNVDRVRVPLLIAHGDLDRRVLPSQSKAMVRALEQAGKPVEWMPLEDEGHGFTWVRSRVKFYAAVLDFLDRHLAAATAEGAGAETQAQPK